MATKKIVFTTVGTSFVNTPDLLPASSVPGFDPHDFAHWDGNASTASSYATAVKEDVVKALCERVREAEEAASVAAGGSSKALALAREKRKLLTAELASLVAIRASRKELRDENATVMVFIASDTVAGAWAAELAVAVAKKCWGYVSCKRPGVEGLSPHAAGRFCQQGLVTLGQIVVDETRTKTLDPSQDVFFNITGGFKGTIPFLQLLALAMGARCCYLFEDSDTLIWLPRIGIDLGRVTEHPEEFTGFLRALRELNRPDGQPDRPRSA